MWSDEHFKLIEKSLELMAEAGNDILGVQAVARSYLGDDPVIVFRKQGGKYVPEFKFFDRYIQLYDRIVGKPLFFSVHVWTWGSRGGVETGREPVIIKELRGDELVTAELPPFGGPGTEELWRTTLEGVRERVKKLGWREDGILLGTGGDSIPLRRPSSSSTRSLLGPSGGYLHTAPAAGIGASPATNAHSTMAW